jgi:uncharacterized membrane protein
MWHFVFSHALAVLFWVPVAWGVVKIKHRADTRRAEGRARPAQRDD